MKEKIIRNAKLYSKWQIGGYSIRSLARMFKISHVRASKIIKSFEEREEIIRIEALPKKARKKSWEAQKKGKLKRPKACSKCGYKTEKVQGHHENYEEALKVKWLCPSCHSKRHAELKKIKSGN